MPFQTKYLHDAKSARSWHSSIYVNNERTLDRENIKFSVPLWKFDNKKTKTNTLENIFKQWSCILDEEKQWL